VEMNKTMTRITGIIGRNESITIEWKPSLSQIKDIDKTKFNWFLRKAKAERNFDIDPEISINEGLARLNLIENGKLSNTAILLFGKEPQRFVLQARIRAGRFKDVNSLDFIDMKVLDGTIPELREKAMKFIMEHIKRGVFFDDNRRYDKWEYPPGT